MTTWRDYPNTSTPITAAALNSLEARVDGAVSTASRTSAAVTSGLAEQKKEIAKKLAADRIRVGKVSISNVPRLGFSGLAVTFDRPFSSSNYVVILTIGGSGNHSPELMTAVCSTSGKTNNGFFGRVRNNANSAQPCEVSYIAIQI